MDTDAIFQRVGSCGPFQACHVILVQLLRMVASWAMFTSTFTLYNPGWRCAHKENSNETSEHPDDVIFTTSPWNGTFGTSPLKATNSERSIRNCSSQVVGTDCSEKRNQSIILERESVFANKYNVTCRDFGYCESVDFDPTSVTIVSDFDLICDKALVSNIIVFINIVGIFLGCICAGQTGEMFGRKKSLYTNAFLLAVCQFACIFAVTWEVYAAINFFSGVMIGGIVTTNVIYAHEYLNVKWRGVLGGLPVWNVSITIFAAIITGVKNWRYVHLTTAVATVLVFLGVAWVPESFRWLYVHKKEKEMEAVLKKMALANRMDVNVSEFTVFRREELNSDLSNDADKKYTYIDLFRTSPMRALTLKTSLAWFCMHISYYTLGFGTKDLAGNFYVNMVLSGFTEIPFTLLLIPMTNRFGRIRTAIAFQIVVFLCSMAIVIILFGVKSDDGYNVMRFLAIVAKASSFSSWSSLCIHSAESFPTVVRSLAQGVFNTAGMIGVMIAPYLVPDGMLLVSYPVLAASSFVTVALIFSLPETNELSLQEWIGQTSDANADIMTPL